MKLVLAGLTMLLVTAVPAFAQPGGTYPQGGYQQPAYAPLPLSPEDRQILLRGEITPGEHIAGGLIGTWLGLGIGHAVQGRYSDTGYIFTLGELGSFGVLIYGALSCIGDGDYDDSGDGGDCNETAIVAGAIGLVGFRIWEIIDVWGGPSWHNRKYRNLRLRTSPQRYSLSPYVVPASRGDGAVGGLTLRF